jgi:hypothetical protein
VVSGLVLETGCVWIFAWSPRLTATYTPDFTREFFVRLPWLQVSVGPELVDIYSMVWVLEIGLLATIVGYVLGLRALSRASVDCAGWVVLCFALAFRLTLILLPGFFSTDILSYVMYGRVAAVYGGNPYLQLPADYPGDAFVSWVFPFWRDAPTVYGPAWTDFGWVLAKLTANWSNFDQVLTYKLTLGVMELLTLALVWWLLGRTRPDDGSRRARLIAFGMFAWNPLVLFDLVGNAHNDTAMVLLMLLGLSLAAGERPLTGAVAMVLGALVKYTSAIAMLFWAVAWAAQGMATRSALGRLAVAGAIAIAFTLGLAWPWLTTPGALGSFEQAAEGRLVLNSAPDLVALTIADQIAVPLGVDKEIAEANVRFWIRVITRTVFAAYVVYEVWRLWGCAQRSAQEGLRSTVRAAARTLLVLPLLVMTWVWSWYLTWPLALAVLLGWRSRLTRLVVAYTLIGLPIVYAHQYLGDNLSGAWVLLFALGPLAVWLIAHAMLQSHVAAPG